MAYVEFTYIVHAKTHAQQSAALWTAFPYGDQPTMRRLTKCFTDGPYREKRIRCSFEQFTRFILASNQTGMVNRIRELKPTLVEGPTPEIFDMIEN